ncbi:MAG: hypothetical protein GY945_01170 [Rhodobacteraceae bacterium]|nr:hypothetical protein [Paracoccaceae bacterium]
MSMAAGFLGGAKDRLLPASIPFRFFLSAAAFHILAWAVLFMGADQVAGFSGGTGPVLAAIHLATLGVFSMTAIGASYQLFPVVTGRALARTWPVRLSFWFLLPGIILLAYGMGLGTSLFMQTGAVLVTVGLVMFAFVMAGNLSRAAGSMPVVAAHGWAALVALIMFAGLGLALIWDFEVGFLADHSGLAILHMIMASFGFMGLLVGGLSLILIPMFVLTRSLGNRPGWVQLALAGLALVCFSIANLMEIPALNWLAVLAGLITAGTYIWQMRKAQAASMRKRLGLSFILIRSSWGLLILTLVIGGVIQAGLPIPNAPALFGFALLAGWLLTFLTGVLQRIMPFLASMHASGMSGLPMLMSELVVETPLKIHAYSHFAALALVGAGIVLDMTVLVQLGAVSGTIGALAFLAFALNVVLKLRASQQGNRDIKRGKRQSSRARK